MKNSKLRLSAEKRNPGCSCEVCTCETCTCGTVSKGESCNCGIICSCDGICLC